MNRRSVLKRLSIITAGVIVAPACNQSGTGTATTLKNISVSTKDQDMLASLAETILPVTKNFTGSRDLKSHEFLLRMIDDCTSPEDQKKFTDGLKSFNQYSQDKFGRLFTGLSDAQKNTLLTELGKNNEIHGGVNDFYKTVRRYTLQSFTTSKPYMLKIKKYNMVPGGNFKGCVKV
jgi:hypothetical protein